MHLPSDQQMAPEPDRTQQRQQTSLPRMSWFSRGLSFGLGTGLVVLFVLASTLSPDPAGIGTHEQLGLPPCGLNALFEIPCPACGMTTSWVWFSHGHWIRSAQSNLGGFLMALLALPTLAWCLTSAFQGHWKAWFPRPFVIAGLMGATLAVTLIQWLFRLPI